jgi:predicted DNA-binding ribbon-helix-helix protein
LGGGAAAVVSAALRKRSLSLSGHRTSVALEPEFWQALDGLAMRRQMTLAALVAEVDAGRAASRPLASALRVLALHAAGNPEEEA